MAPGKEVAAMKVKEVLQGGGSGPGSSAKAGCQGGEKEAAATVAVAAVEGMRGLGLTRSDEWEVRQ
jgi:hypothetical protein